MKKKSRILLICIVLTLVAAIFVIAAYTSRSYVKGVATTPKQSLELSSDYLVVVAQSAPETSYAVRKILLDEKSENDNSDYTFSFYIQNSADGSVSKKTMKYALKITGLPDRATVYSGENIDITGDVKSTEGAESMPMAAYTKATHNYKITIPKDDIKNLKSDIVITAIPDSDSDSSGNMLAAKVQISVAGVVAGFSYSGSFLDKTQANNPYDFAAFNYEVSVSNATKEHTMVLSWNKNYVEIDPLFLDLINKTPTVGSDNNNILKVEFPMDANRNNYLIKFYRLKGQNASDEWQQSWSNLEEIISFQEGQQ